jgi:hypothetical protein
MMASCSLRLSNSTKFTRKGIQMPKPVKQRRSQTDRETILFPTGRINLDGYVKSPDAALHFILRHCGVHHSMPHSSGFVRLACGLFT